MTRLVALFIVLGLVAGANAASAQTPQPAADAAVTVGGGTPLTNGAFFPGTAIYDEASKEFIGEPLAVTQGSNLRLVNVDAGAVANGHGIRSICKLKAPEAGPGFAGACKKSRSPRPMFASPVISGPGETTVITESLKPGVYAYGCPVHFGMFGLIEVQ